MAKGRQQELWTHTSHLLAWIQNFGSRKVEPVRARDLNPMAPKEKPIVIKDFSMLRDAFMSTRK